MDTALALNFINKGSIMRMKKLFKIAVSLLTSFVMTASSTVCFAEEVSTEEEKGRIVIDSANVSFVQPDGWSGVSTGKMVKKQLDALGVAEATVTSDFKKNNGHYLGKSANKSIQLYVTSFGDDTSEKIFNSNTGDYNLVSEYLNNPEKFKYTTFQNGMVVKRTSDKIMADGAAFHLVEYTEGDKMGLCYSTVVNGKYISFDFKGLTGKISDADKIIIVNTMNSVKILNLEEKETLDQDQIIIIGGVAFIAVLFFGSIIAVNNKKKRR